MNRKHIGTQSYMYLKYVNRTNCRLYQLHHVILPEKSKIVQFIDLQFNDNDNNDNDDIQVVKQILGY